MVSELQMEPRFGGQRRSAGAQAGPGSKMHAVIVQQVPKQGTFWRGDRTEEGFTEK